MQDTPVYGIRSLLHGSEQNSLRTAKMLGSLVEQKPEAKFGTHGLLKQFLDVQNVSVEAPASKKVRTA